MLPKQKLGGNAATEFRMSVLHLIYDYSDDDSISGIFLLRTVRAVSIVFVIFLTELHIVLSVVKHNNGKTVKI